MSCLINKGRTLPCKNVGGIKNVYFFNNIEDLVDDITVVDDVVTSTGGAITIYKYAVRGGQASFEEANEGGDGGASFWTGTLNVTLHKQDAASQNVLKLLAYGRPHAIIEDYNGNFRLIGTEFGTETTVSTSTGVNLGDPNAYTIVATSMEKNPAYFINNTLIDSPSGFDISANTVNV
jgi:hypothetical protein